MFGPVLPETLNAVTALASSIPWARIETQDDNETPFVIREQMGLEPWSSQQFPP